MSNRVAGGQAAGGYASLGLDRNPFVAESTPGVAAEHWVPRPLPDPPRPSGRRLVQVIGERGAGKTSLMLRWRGTAGGPYHHVPASPLRWLPPPVAPLCYWDELDRLARPTRRLALRRAAAAGATVVAGTHEDLADEARRAGLTPETIALPLLSTDDLLVFAAMRIVSAALRGVTPALALPRPLAAEIARDCGGSWRLAADRLHVWASEATRQGHE